MKALFLFLGCILIQNVRSQQVYDSELGMPLAFFIGLHPVTDGGNIAVGRIGADHLVVRWDAQGDTLWTRRQPRAGVITYESLLLTNGHLLVSSSIGGLVFDQQGVLLDTIPVMGNAFQVGADNLVFIGMDSLRSTDLEGHIAWSVGRMLPVVPNAYFNAFGCRVGEHLALFTGFSNTVSHAGLLLHRYTLDGVFVDSVALHRDMGSMTFIRALVPTSDGGACGVAMMGFGSTHLIRLDQNGGLLWHNRFGVESGNAAFPDLVDCIGLVASSDGGVVLSANTMDAMTRNLDLLQVDAAGTLVCRENVAVAEMGVHAQELAMNAEGRMALLHANDVDGIQSPWTLSGWNLAGFCAPEFGGAQELLALPDGGGVWVTSAEGSVQLKHWAADGTVQWTRIHDGPPVRSALVAPNGSILVVGDQESRWFDPTGDLLSVFTTEGGDCSWIGADSILFTTAERIKLMDPSGEIIWDHAITMEDGCSSTALSRGLRSGSRLLVLSECSVPSASRTFLSTYDLNGEPQGSMMVRENAASTLAPQALLFAGTEAVAVSSSVLDGSTLVFRCSATADTLWSSWFPNGTDEQGAAATAAAISVEGHILLGARTAAGIDLLGLDAFGGSPCLETIIPEDGDPSFAMVLDANGLLWTGYASEAESAPSQHLLATDPGTFCSSAGMEASYGASACGQPRFDGLTWTIGGTGCHTTLEYVIMDVSGRAVHEGILRTGTDHLPLLAGPGLYLVRAVDRAHGEAFTVRLIQP